jgi:hypothetical protein
MMALPLAAPLRPSLLDVLEELYDELAPALASDDKAALRTTCRRALAAADGGARVLRLIVAWDADGLAALLARRRWPMLRSLDARHSQFSFPHARLWSRGAAALAAHPLPHLAELRLDDNALGDAGASALAAAPWPLRRLGVARCGVTAAGAAALAAAPWPLEALGAADNPALGAAGAAALAAARWPLREADLRRCGLAGAVGVGAALDGARWRPSLCVLLLAGNELGDGGAEALARQPLPALAVLDCAAAGLSRRGARALAAAGWARGCASLSVAGEFSCVLDRPVEAKKHPETNQPTSHSLSTGHSQNKFIALNSQITGSATRASRRSPRGPGAASSAS